MYPVVDRHMLHGLSDGRYRPKNMIREKHGNTLEKDWSQLMAGAQLSQAVGGETFESVDGRGTEATDLWHGHEDLWLQERPGLWLPLGYETASNNRLINRWLL